MSSLGVKPGCKLGLVQSKSPTWWVLGLLLQKISVIKLVFFFFFFSQITLVVHLSSIIIVYFVTLRCTIKMCTSLHLFALLMHIFTGHIFPIAYLIFLCRIYPTPDVGVNIVYFFYLLSTYFKHVIKMAHLGPLKIISEGGQISNCFRWIWQKWRWIHLEVEVICILVFKVLLH